MIKSIFIFIFVFAQFSYAKLNVVVSIQPEVTFVKKIGGEKINIKLMVKPGNSPHLYEPKPSQMKDISKANIYFAIGVEFEKVWLPKFTNQNQQMQVIHIDDHIKKIQITQHEDKHEKIHEKKYKNEHDHENKDPHIWTSPKNVKVIAQNIYNTLAKLDKENQAYYKINLDKFLAEIEETDKTIKSLLLNKKGSNFMVFHPSWGYFAREYDLVQIAIEIEGKTPKPKGLIKIIEDAKKENIRAIFVQPEFSDKISITLAKQLKINVIKTSPLNKNWSKNLINLAKAIK